MAQTSRERFLFFIVIIAGTALGGWFIYKQVIVQWQNLEEDTQDRIMAIQQMQNLLEQSAEITSRYDVLANELQLPGDYSEQQFKIRQDMTQILTQVGLDQTRYRNIDPKDPKEEDDFKIVSISISDIQCTPTQLGDLLYRIEAQSEAMQVEDCQISNLVGETGQLPAAWSSGRRGPVPQSGILSVDLQIARLVEYSTEELKLRNKKRK